MTIQTLFDAWIASDTLQSMEPPVTEADLRAAEAKIGSSIPPPLRELYMLCNGGWMLFYLDFYSLEPCEHNWGLIRANEEYIERGWHIPQEIRLFADEAASDVFGVWLPCCSNPIYNHPIIEVGTIFEEGCMGVAGTNLISFLRGWAAYYLVADEREELAEDGEKLKAIQTALDTLGVPQSLRGNNFDDERAPFRKWADPQLPDPYGTSYSQGYTITDLKRLFGESR